MRIEYRRTFSQFVDNYLATYYGTPGQTAFRLIGGPTMMVVAALITITTNAASVEGTLRFAFLCLSAPLFILGLYYMLRPALEILLVWLRREEFLGPENATIALELHDDYLRVFEGNEQFDLPIDQILSIWRRKNSAWVITKTDNLIYFPFEGLLSGDADIFLEALEAKLPTDDEE